MKTKNISLLTLLIIPALAILNGCGGGNSEPKGGSGNGSGSSASRVIMHLGEVVERNDSNIEYCSSVADGEPCEMNQEQAEAYCHTIPGAHLPSAWEYANFAAAHGAAGIRATAYPNSTRFDDNLRAEMTQMSTENYSPVFKPNTTEVALNSVDFYFSPVGFRETDDGQPNYVFWTSSERQAHSFYTFSDENNGESAIIYDDFTAGHEVKCMLR